MLVNSVNNVSFSSKTQNKNIKEDKSQYYKYLSQRKTNNAVMMSYGREEENGKYIDAAGKTSLAGCIGLLTSTLASAKIDNKIKQVKDNASFKNLTVEEGKKVTSGFNKKANIATMAMAASVALLAASSVIQSVNKIKANKTANERGFLSEGDNNKIKDQKTLYSSTDYIYNNHIAG